MPDVKLDRDGVIVEGGYVALHSPVLELKDDRRFDRSRRAGHQRKALLHDEEDRLSINFSGDYRAVVLNGGSGGVILEGPIHIDPLDGHGDGERQDLREMLAEILRRLDVIENGPPPPQLDPDLRDQLEADFRNDILDELSGQLDSRIDERLRDRGDLPRRPAVRRPRRP